MVKNYIIITYTGYTQICNFQITALHIHNNLKRKKKNHYVKAKLPQDILNLFGFDG